MVNPLINGEKSLLQVLGSRLCWIYSKSKIHLDPLHRLDLIEGFSGNPKNYVVPVNTCRTIS